MDESWRMRMGIPTTPSPRPLHLPSYPHRRSAEESSSHRRKHFSDEAMDAEGDFSDVFGGPPRTVLSRQFSTCGFQTSFSSTNFFYEEIFQPPEKAAPSGTRNGRSLPQFSIPGQERSNCSQYRRQKDGFYSDIFGFQDDQRSARSRSRSKASSSSVLSSEDLSPLRPAVSGDDGDDISFFASKLRPLNLRSRWSSVRMGYDDHQKGNHPIYNFENEKTKSYPSGLSRRNASPETISLEPISNSSFRVSADDLELNSPSSAVSSVFQSDREQKTRDNEDQMSGQDIADDEDDEVMSSYVIEIISDNNREGTCEANGVDEAIAWAREKSQSHCPISQECEKEKPSDDMLKGHQFSEGHTDSYGSLDEQEKWAAEEEMPQLESMMLSEMQILDEKLSLWSTGKEVDIRLLLSSLHHILWPNSGWLAIPLMNLIDSSQVKKAYQKARLCLHPDKLQQRGATLPQKYVADKAFSVLQDAWASFISQDES